MKQIAYCRLSREDGDGESSSISNQKKIIKEFAYNNNFKIDEYLCDDGWSGYIFDRPAFNKLKEYLENDEVDTIIVKDLSRIGRHNARVQLFLEEILEYGKRVIAIYDNYDTFDVNTHDTMGIQTWVNEKYVRDTSKKVRESFYTLQKEGRLICKVPYGYIKDDFHKSQYKIDTLTAPYVKMIYDMYIDGMGLKKIARELTNKNIPTPSMIIKQYKEAKGLPCHIVVSDKWESTVILRMLKNDFYIGTLTLGKTKKRSINGKDIEVPKEDRHIFEDAHEPIIDKQTFQLVQELITKRASGNYRGKRVQTRPNLFAGIMYCNDCGRLLTTAGGAINTRYVCRTYNTHGTSQCTSHATLENEMKATLIEFLEHCRDNLSDIIEDIDNIIQTELQTKNNSSDNITLLTKQLINTKESLKVLMEQKVRETINNPSMVEMIDKIYNEAQNEKYKLIQSLEKQLADQKQIAIDENGIKDSLNKTLSIINEIIDKKALTRKQVLILVDKIIVYDDSSVDIYLKGDLHEICNNYIKIHERKTNKIKSLMYNYIINNQEKFVTGDIVSYVCNHGVKVIYATISQIIKDELLNKGLVEFRPMKHGYKVICSQQELERALLINTVANTYGEICNNNDKFLIATHIYEWIKGIESKKHKKFVF